MHGKECKIVCDGKEIAVFECSEDGFTIKFTEEGKKMHKEHHKGCC